MRNDDEDGDDGYYDSTHCYVTAVVTCAGWFGTERVWSSNTFGPLSG